LINLNNPFQRTQQRTTKETYIMFNNLYLKAAMVRMALENPAELVKQLERGDADSSGSTMRTLGVVTLILIIFAVIAAAVTAAANQAAVGIQNPL
jgi:hypothetical protein